MAMVSSNLQYHDFHRSLKCQNENEISDNIIVVHSGNNSDVAVVRLRLLRCFPLFLCQLAIIERLTEAVRKRLSSNNLHLIFAACLICFSTFAQVNQPKVSIWANCITKRVPK